jgi:hypothetical protein
MLSSGNTLASKYTSISHKATLTHLRRIGVMDTIDHYAAQGIYSTTIISHNEVDTNYINNLSYLGFNINVREEHINPYKVVINIDWKPNSRLTKFLEIINSV